LGGGPGVGRDHDQRRDPQTHLCLAADAANPARPSPRRVARGALRAAHVARGARCGQGPVSRRPDREGYRASAGRKPNRANGRI
jgi:hypothetical protein